MVTVAYLAYGPRRFTETTVFSALTFIHAAAPSSQPWNLVVYTDAPELFTAYGVECDLFPTESLEDRRTLPGYSYRLKLMAVRDCAERYDGDLFFVDGDTYFLGPAEDLFGRVSASHSVLHQFEWTVSERTQPRLHRLIADVSFESPTLRAARRRSDLPMWNSGTIGIAEGTKPAIYEVIEICDELCAADGYHAMEQFAWGLALERRSEIAAVDDLIYHYWHAREEVTHRIVRFLRGNRRLPPDELAARAYDLRPTASESWRPPMEIRARRAVRSVRSRVKGVVANTTSRSS